MEQRKVDGAIILPTSRHPRGDGFDDSTRMDLFSRPSFCLSLGLFVRSSMDGVHWTLTGRDAILEGLLSHLGSRCVSFVFFLFNNLDTGVSSPFSPIDLVPGGSMDSTGQGPVFFFVDFKQVVLEAHIDEFPRSWTLIRMSPSLYRLPSWFLRDMERGLSLSHGHSLGAER